MRKRLNRQKARSSAKRYVYTGELQLPSIAVVLGTLCTIPIALFVCNNAISLSSDKVNKLSALIENHAIVKGERYFDPKPKQWESVQQGTYRTSRKVSVSYHVNGKKYYASVSGAQTRDVETSVPPIATFLGTKGDTMLVPADYLVCYSPDDPALSFCTCEEDATKALGAELSSWKARYYFSVAPLVICVVLACCVILIVAMNIIRHFYLKNRYGQK